MKSKSSYIILGIAVAAVVAALICLVVAPFYKCGSPIVHAIVMAVSVALMIGGTIGMAIPGRDSVQQIARLAPIRRMGVWLMLVTVIDIVACIVTDYDLSVAYYVLMAIIVAACVVQFSMASVGSIEQLKTDESIANAGAIKADAVASLRGTVTCLMAAIDALDVPVLQRSPASAAVRSVMESVEAMPVRLFERRPAVVDEIRRCNTRLVQLKDGLAGGDVTSALTGLESEVRAMVALLRDIR